VLRPDSGWLASGSGQLMVTVSTLDSGETGAVSAVHRAWAITLFWPAVLHEWEAETVPAASQPESKPSPQLNRYCTVCPADDVEPPVE